MDFFRITNGFKKLVDRLLIGRANSILVSMTGNVHFPTPSPSLTVVGDMISNFTEAVNDAESGGLVAKALRDQVRLQVIDTLHLLGQYVLFASAGDRVVALTSGFHISKIAVPTPPIGVAQNVTLKNGINKGELEMNFDKVLNARCYIYEITESPVTPESVWQRSTNTIAKHLFTGLESATDYTCRVAAVGIKKQMTFSNTVSHVAQ